MLLAQAEMLAGSFRGGSSIALLVTSRVVDGSLHVLLSVRRASQNQVQELPRLRPRSWRATSTSPRGVATVTISDRFGTAPPAGMSFGA